MPVTTPPVDDVEALLTTLRHSPTDLVRIVTEVLGRSPAMLYLSRQTVDAWQDRDPAAWARVRAWLDRRHVGLKVVAP